MLNIFGRPGETKPAVFIRVLRDFFFVPHIKPAVKFVRFYFDILKIDWLGVTGGILILSYSFCLSENLVLYRRRYLLRSEYRNAAYFGRFPC
jgi:hypothetical protein